MNRTVLTLCGAGLACLSVTAAVAQTAAMQGDRPNVGAKVYDSACAACHATGVGTAPRVGDRVRWARLVKEGPAKVTAHGWLGERAMPPRGGVPDLALADFAQAVAVMAERSQAQWPVVDAAHLQAVEREITKEADKRARRARGGKPAPG